jgi:hypothetical protein
VGCSERHRNGCVGMVEFQSKGVLKRSLGTL